MQCESQIDRDDENCQTGISSAFASSLPDIPRRTKTSATKSKDVKRRCIVVVLICSLPLFWFRRDEGQILRPPRQRWKHKETRTRRSAGKQHEQQQHLHYRNALAIWYKHTHMNHAHALIIRQTIRFLHTFSLSYAQTHLTPLPHTHTLSIPNNTKTNAIWILISTLWFPNNCYHLELSSSWGINGVLFEPDYRGGPK